MQRSWISKYILIMNRLLITAIFLAALSSGCNSGKKSSHESSIAAQKDGVPVYLTEESFKEKVFNFDKNKEWKYEGTKPAVIDFYADWCAPCRQLSPILEDVVKGYNGRVILYKVDTEKEKDLTGKLGVEALPTLLYIPVNGKPQARMGLVSREDLKQAIDQILPKE